MSNEEVPPDSPIQNALPEPYLRQAEQAHQEAKEKLKNIDRSPFSNTGFVTYLEYLGAYQEDLLREAHNVKMRKGSDLISSSDVRRASENLTVSPMSSYVKLTEALGLLGAGGGLGYLLSVNWQAPLPMMNILPAIIFLVVGIALATWAIARR